MRVHYLQHVQFEGIGSIENFLSATAGDAWTLVSRYGIRLCRQSAYPFKGCFAHRQISGHFCPFPHQ